MYVEGTKARAQTLASLLYSLSANPGFFKGTSIEDTSTFGAMSASSTSSTIIHPLHAQPFAIASDTLSCSCVQCQPFSFCHIHHSKLKTMGEVLHILYFISFSFLCRYKFNHQNQLLLLGHLLANSSESLSCSCLHFQPISFTSTSSPTTTLWLCHIQLQLLDHGGSLLHRNLLFCWNESSSPF